ncbi:inner membrane ABC transporter permease ynjC domain protein [Shigella dysenteriae 225-75]|nr:inner membrane ABC transporter permease ynjC domain protein [Shigella dysenteriae 225-75]
MDVAIILGPGNPPTLAVISWQWLTQGDADQQTKGALASLLLMLLLAAYVLLSYLLWRSWRRTIPRVDGIRNACHTFITRHYAGEFFTLNRCAVCGSAGDPRGSVDDQ